MGRHVLSSVIRARHMRRGSYGRDKITALRCTQVTLSRQVVYSHRFLILISIGFNLTCSLSSRNSLNFDINIVGKFGCLDACPCWLWRWKELCENVCVNAQDITDGGITTCSYTWFISPKLSMFFRYTFTLTTFSHDDPAASRTLPKLLMHCAYTIELEGKVSRTGIYSIQCAP
jgi:hypothetical protein